MGRVHHIADARRSRSQTYFTRAELHRLLDLYSRRVMRGDWRDYAIDHLSGAAVFSIFRHTHEAPLFSVIKRADGRPAPYLLLRGPCRLAAGDRLEPIIAALAKELRLVASSS